MVAGSSSGRGSGSGSGSGSSSSSSSSSSTCSIWVSNLIFLDFDSCCEFCPRLTSTAASSKLVSGKVLRAK